MNIKTSSRYYFIKTCCCLLTYTSLWQNDYWMWNIFSFDYIFKTGKLKIHKDKQLSDTAVLRCYTKKMFLKTLQNWWKTPMLELLFSEEAWRPATFLHHHRCFHLNIAKIFRTTFSQAPLGDCFWIV